MMPMALATVVISGREWLLPAMGFVAVAGVLLLWSYRRAPVRGPIGGICFALKLLGVLALAGCLIEPLWTGQRARPGANFFAILADNSQSMQIKDRAEKLTRGSKKLNVRSKKLDVRSKKLTFGPKTQAWVEKTQNRSEKLTREWEKLTRESNGSVLSSDW